MLLEMLTFWYMFFCQCDDEDEVLCLDSKVLSEGAYLLYSTLNRRELDPIKLPYNPCRPDRWLTLTTTTASAFYRLKFTY